MVEERGKGKAWRLWHTLAHDGPQRQEKKFILTLLAGGAGEKAPRVQEHQAHSPESGQVRRAERRKTHAPGKRQRAKNEKSKHRKIEKLREQQVDCKQTQRTGRPNTHSRWIGSM